MFHGPDWPARPSGLHVLYLVAAVALFAAVALLRHGIRPARLAAAVTAAAVAVPAGAAATAAAPGGEEMNPPLARGMKFTARLVPARVRDRYLGPDSRRCEKRGAVTYCAFPRYVSWIPLWASAVEPVVEALPPAARGRLPVVRQYSDSWWMADDHDDRSIGTFMVWGRAGAADAHRGALASALVGRLVRLRATGDDPLAVAAALALLMISAVAAGAALGWGTALTLLRMTAVLLGAAAAFTVSDAMDADTGATPVPRRARQGLRRALGALGAGLTWAAACAIAVARLRAGDELRAPGMAVEAAVCVAVGLLSASVAARLHPGRVAGLAGTGGLLAAVSVSLVARGPYWPWPYPQEDGWEEVRHGWLAALVVVVALLGPACGDLRSRIRRPVRRGRCGRGRPAPRW
ncbi:hypothetical protein [Streptosporangium sandarakinum]|uniref:hypothetical protein n=1 Tax=Streptosporangium sandarakinum TaxID=1260955 RepID=UPI00371E9802